MVIPNPDLLNRFLNNDPNRHLNFGQEAGSVVVDRHISRRLFPLDITKVIIKVTSNHYRDNQISILD